MHYIIKHFNTRHHIFISTLALTVLTNYQAPAQSNNITTDKIFLTVSLETNKCYIGQTVALNLTWGAQSPLESFKAVNIKLPVLRDENFKSYDSYKTDDQPDSKSLGLPVSDTRLLAKRSETLAEQITYQTLTVKKIITPVNSGTFTIAPATIECVQLTGAPNNNTPQRKSSSSGLYQYPLYFNNNFFEYDTKNEGENKFAISNTNYLEVLSLPERAPQGFSGLVGEYQLHVTASHSSVRTGDPVTLQIQITSSGYLANARIPALKEQPLFVKQFDIADDCKLSSINNDAISFTQTIFPRDHSVQNIPQLSLTYFNPYKQSYITTSSDPIPIEVRSAEVINGSIFESSSKYVRKNTYYIVFCLFLAGILIFLRITQRKPERIPVSSPTIHNKEDAYRTFNTAVKLIANRSFTSDQEQYQALRNTLNSYLHTHIQEVQTGAITKNDITAWLKPLVNSAEAITMMSELFHEIEVHLYAKSSTGTEFSKNVSTAVETVKTINKLG